MHSSALLPSTNHDLAKTKKNHINCAASTTRRNNEANLLSFSLITSSIATITIHQNTNSPSRSELQSSYMYEPIKIELRKEFEVVTDNASPLSPLVPNRQLPWLFPKAEYFCAPTWSSNYTASNLPGPGRILGKIFSSAGSSLERRLETFAYRVGLGRYAKAELSLQNTGRSCLFIFEDTDETSRGRICKTLLEYARSVTNRLTLLNLFT